VTDELLSVEAARALLVEVGETWDRIVAGENVTTRRLHIAGVDVEVVLAGAELTELLVPAFAGLPPACGPVRGTVGAWDVSATGLGFPPRPDTMPERGTQCVIRRDGRPVAELAWVSDRALRTGDRVAHRHLLAVASVDDLKWETGAPLRRQLSWELAPEVLFVHAGAVGGADGAALVMGGAGAGKSSTALACLQAGMGFISDDYCLVREEPLVVFPLHSTARVYDADVPLLPGLPAPAITGASIVVDDPEEKPKALYRVGEAMPDRLLASAPVRVVLVPSVGDGPGRLEPMRTADALRCVAPGTLRQMSLEPELELAGLRRLVAAVPCFRLVLSPDRAANPDLVQQALALATTS
jgi:hypothetical protein